MTTADFHAQDHSMTRLDISTGMPFNEFQAVFEKAAPYFDAEDAIRRFTTGGGKSWDDMAAQVADLAPNGLMIYARIDITPALALAGHATKAVEYLMGNHVIAETMLRRDTKAALYAPLRILVHSDPSGNAVFSLDQPSTAFSSLGIDEVTQVGKGLDRKVAALLRVVGVDADEAFSAGPNESPRLR